MHIYLDNSATTGLDPLVLQAMLPWLGQEPSNPSSVHSWGRQAKQALVASKDHIAKILGVYSEELTFTSGGTEAINTVIRGILSHKEMGHIISSNVEHAAVDLVLSHLETLGWKVTRLKVGFKGCVNLEDLESSICENTRLIICMAVNNETGIENPIQEIAQIAHRRGIDFFVDAVACWGRSDFTIHPGITAFAISAHKFHGPKGAGLFYLKKGVKFTPLLFGGGQEKGRRSGTESLHSIVGMAKAMELCDSSSKQYLKKLGQYLTEKILQVQGATINGCGPRVAHILNVSFQDIDAESLLMWFDQRGVAVSHGSACSSGALEPSKILIAMGYSYRYARSSLRISLSRTNTYQEIDQFIELLTQALSSF